MERIVDLFIPHKEYYESGKNELSKEFTQETAVMFDLLRWLVGKFCYYIKEFENDRLPTAYVVKRIKQCHAEFSEFILTIHDDQSQSDYETSFIKLKTEIENQGRENLLKNQQRSLHDFENYLFQIHPEFDQKSKTFSPEMRRLLIDSVFKFFLTAINSVQQRLPFIDSIPLNVRCISFER